MVKFFHKLVPIVLTIVAVMAVGWGLNSEAASLETFFETEDYVSPFFTETGD